MSNLARSVGLTQCSCLELYSIRQTYGTVVSGKYKQRNTCITYSAKADVIQMLDDKRPAYFMNRPYLEGEVVPQTGLAEIFSPTLCESYLRNSSVYSREPKAWTLALLVIDLLVRCRKKQEPVRSSYNLRIILLVL